MKIVQEQRLQLKMEFLLGYNMKDFIYFEGYKFDGGHFSWWRGMTKLSANGETPHHPVSRENHSGGNNLVL